MPRFGAVAAGACLLAFAPTAAQANSTTFAQFAQLAPGAKPFTYTPTSGGAQLGSLLPANTVLISALGSLASPSFAVVSLNAISTAAPTPGAEITQLFSGSLTFTLLAPQLGLSGMSTNALTVNFTNAVFATQANSEAPTLTADDHLGATISYSSDFINLSGLTNKNFGIAFSGSSAPMALSGGQLPQARFSGGGTFAGAVPEPATWAFMLAGFGLVGATMRSRRRTIELA